MAVWASLDCNVQESRRNPVEVHQCAEANLQLHCYRASRCLVPDCDGMGWF